MKYKGNKKIFWKSNALWLALTLIVQPFLIALPVGLTETHAAIGTPTLATPTVATTGTSVDTASFTPTANSVLIAYTLTDSGIGYLPATVSDSLDSTWTEIGSGFSGPDISNWVSAKLYYQEIGASPAARTVNAAQAANTNGIALVVVELTGISTDFSNINSAGDVGSDPSLSISAPAASSAVLGFAGSQSTNAFSSLPSGHTSLQNGDPGATNSVAVSYDLTSPSESLSWVHPNASNGVGIGLEIKDASAEVDATPNRFFRLFSSVPFKLFSGRFILYGNPQ